MAKNIRLLVNGEEVKNNQKFPVGTRLDIQVEYPLHETFETSVVMKKGKTPHVVGGILKPLVPFTVISTGKISLNVDSITYPYIFALKTCL